MRHALIGRVCAVLWPSSVRVAPPQRTRPFAHGEMVASVCPDPSTKLLEMRSRFSPAGHTASAVAWRELHEGLLAGVPRYDHAGKATRTVSGQVRRRCR